MELCWNELELELRKSWNDECWLEMVWQRKRSVRREEKKEGRREKKGSKHRGFVRSRTPSLSTL